MRRVALTGGIATGKSWVRRRFAHHGVPTIDADVLAHAAGALTPATVDPADGPLGAVSGGTFAEPVLVRVLGDEIDARIDRSSWESPRVFRELQRIGDVDDREMLRVFNMGIGMAIVLSPDAVHRAMAVLDSHGHRAVVIGEIVPGSGAVAVT